MLLNIKPLQIADVNETFIHARKVQPKCRYRFISNGAAFAHHCFPVVPQPTSREFHFRFSSNTRFTQATMINGGALHTQSRIHICAGTNTSARTASTHTTDFLQLSSEPVCVYVRDRLCLSVCICDSHCSACEWILKKYLF